jgi:hypothetical protein
MANLTRVPANVALMSDSATVRIVQVGEAVQQGQPLYQNTANSKYMLCSDASAVAADCKGVALTPAGADGYVVMALPGSEITVGATLVVGMAYYVSAAGEIKPAGDVSTGEFVTLLGIATATNRLPLRIVAVGIAAA